MCNTFKMQHFRGQHVGDLVAAKAHAPKRLQRVDDQARLFRLNWEIKYDECDLAPKHLECKPVLTLYLGNQFVRDIDSGGVVHIPLDEDNLATRYSGSLVGTLRRDKGATLPLDAPICMASSALHRNDIGTPCYVDVGTSMALVGDVVTEIQQRGFYDHRHELTMRTAMLQGEESIRKGVISFRVTAYQLGTAVKLPPPNKMPAIGTQALVLERIAATQTREETAMAYVQATMQHEMRFPDSLPNIQRVRVPMDISETGAALTGHCYMPIAAYAMVETPRSNADYFVNAFERVMARANLAGPKTAQEYRSPAKIGAAVAGSRDALSAQAIAAYNQLDTRNKAMIMGRVIAYGVQTMDYIGDARESANRRDLVRDIAAKIPYETMENGWNTGAGDCEDFASALVASRHALLGAQFDINNPKHAPLREIQAMCAEYIATPALSIVHGAKIGDEEGYGAHMYTPMFTRMQFEAALARTKDGRALLERLAPIPAPQAAMGALAVGGAARQTWNKADLPAMTLEGTGILAPLPMNDPILDQRRKVAQQMPSLHGYKMEIPHKVPNPFYLAIANVITDHYVKKEGVPVAGFVVGQVNDQHEMTRGILYEDFLAGSAKMAVAPQPFIPRPVMDIIDHANSARPPIRAHVLDFNKRLAGAPTDANLDRFVSAVRGFKRDPPPPDKAPVNSVDVFVKPHQYNAAKIGAWIQDASQFHDLYDASYEVEHITNDMFTYRLRLWVK